ncbi:MAG: DUF4363 family protein [Oscillospiraceae bacterium]|jgi:hypothetical protein|nr:DUF4363 family protein [Oscillospiraceae bacterium]
MKFLYIGVGILVGLLIICILGGALVAQHSEEIISELSKAVEAFDSGDLDAAIAYADAAKEIWDKHSRLLSSLLSHGQLDDIEHDFSALNSFSITGAKDEFRSQCAMLLTQLQHIAKMDLPYYFNFL